MGVWNDDEDCLLSSGCLPCPLFVGAAGLPVLGIDELVLLHLTGIVISVAVLIAMFGVATRKLMRSLPFLRVILWIGIVKILIVQLRVLAQGERQLLSYIRAILINELVVIPLAVYWSGPARYSFLASRRHSDGSAPA